MFLCKHVLTPRLGQSPLPLFKRNHLFCTGFFFHPGLFKAGFGFQMETSDQESGGSFHELSLSLSIFHRELSTLKWFSDT